MSSTLTLQAISNNLGTETKLAIWPCEEPKAVLHILHGMGEHKFRYEHFANFLNAHHIQVYAHDHLGHGESIDDDSPKGHFHDDKGFQKVISVVEDVQNHIHKQHPDLPIFLLGHSMGSFIAQHYLLNYKSEIKGLILSGSAYTPTFLLKALKLAAQIESLRLGKKGSSKVLNFLSFGSYNNAFKPNRTEFDWLSRDKDSVDAYINDDLCGFICSCASWQQLAEGLLNISNAGDFKKIPAELPVYIVSGDKDPVGGFGKYVRALHQFWLNTGHTNTKLDLLADARHEVLNETDKELTYNKVLQWIQCQDN
jgi:alpha-beta hydrolase superfamily lysophospholipase